MVAGAKHPLEAAQAGGGAGTTAEGKEGRENNGIQWERPGIGTRGKAALYVMKIEGKLSHMYTHTYIKHTQRENTQRKNTHIHTEREGEEGRGREIDLMFGRVIIYGFTAFLTC